MKISGGRLFIFLVIAVIFFFKEAIAVFFPATVIALIAVRTITFTTTRLRYFCTSFDNGIKYYIIEKMLPVNTNYDFPTFFQSLPRLTKNKIELLGKAEFLSLGERIELLLILMHKKWVTEIKKNSKLVTSLLDFLEFAYGKNWRVNSAGKRIEWLQVAANKNILDYVLSRRETLTPLEAGTLYGYPTSHIFGFMKLIPQSRKMPKKHPALHYLSGVYSEELKKEEVEYFKNLWEEMREIAPDLIKKAESEYYTKR
ncbi:hypothetical protein HYW31_00240 [Candidatus Berkelbacteria bacterium]|nr:hypothetical protein [Candidatus Berkelbacteria bacterium]